MAELDVLDAAGNKQKMSTTVDAAGFMVGSTCVTDPTTGAKQAVGTAYSTDAQALSGNSALGTVTKLLWNGSLFDRERGNEDAQSSILTLSGSAVGTYNQTNNSTSYNHRGAVFGINVTQISGGTDVVFTVEGLDVVSGTWYTILATASIGSIEFVALWVYPGIAAVANQAIALPLPRTFRVSATVTGGGTVTATVGMSKII